MGIIYNMYAMALKKQVECLNITPYVIISVVYIKFELQGSNCFLKKLSTGKYKLIPINAK